MNRDITEAYVNENRMLSERVAELTEIIEKAEKALDYSEFWGEVEQVRLRLRTATCLDTVASEGGKAVEKSQQSVAAKLEAAKQQVSERAAAAPPMEHTQSRSSGHGR